MNPVSWIICYNLSPIKCFSAALDFPVKSPKDIPYFLNPAQKREAVIQTLEIEIAEQGASDPLLVLHDKDDFDKTTEGVTEVKKVLNKVSMHGWSLRKREAENRTSLWKEASQTSETAPERVQLRRNETGGRSGRMSSRIMIFQRECIKMRAVMLAGD